MFNSERKMKGGFINELLWLCAGVDRKIVRECPSEYAKYAGMGGTILATSIFATLSGGYAFYIIFKSIVVASILGLFWGLIIFNLDRFIVSTMYSDGKSSISLRELAGAFPRIIIALLLAVIISNPLELKIFEREIEYEIEQLKNTKASDEKLTQLQNDLDILFENRIRIDDMNMSLRKAKEDDLSENSELRKIEDRSLENDNRIKLKEQEIMAYRTKIEAITENFDGYAARLEAFSNVRERNSHVNFAAMIVMILFMIIEITPTIFRLMVATGPYDDLLKAEKHKVKIFAETKIVEANEEAKNRIKLLEENNEKIFKVKIEVMDIAVAKWKEEQLAEMEKNPASFIEKCSEDEKTI